MNKLTKQYRKGTLPSGFYYFKNSFGQTYAVSYHDVSIKGLSGVEIISEVPSYEEFEKLKKQLDIAVKTLIKYEIDSNFEGGVGSAYEDMMWDCTKTLQQIEELEK